MTKTETEKLIESIELGVIKKKKLLLQVCCGPCTTGVFDHLSPYFDITLFYYNPNTYPLSEYNLRLDNVRELKKHYKFDLIEMEYDESEFLDRIKGLENEKEHGKRCPVCFRIRLEETAKFAKVNGFDIFTTTLSVSPYKDADILNSIGNSLEKEYGIIYYYSNFKKKDGYKNSIKNSKEFGLYRQDYCGCRFSLKEREEQLKDKEKNYG